MKNIYIEREEKYKKNEENKNIFKINKLFLHITLNSFYLFYIFYL